MFDTEFKIRLHLHCADLLQKKADTYKEAIAGAQESANAEEKSSAGDKYETGRAMSHLQGDMMARQLKTVLGSLNELGRIDPSISLSKVNKGALIQTSRGLIYIATGFGAIELEKEKITVISSSSPLGLALMNKQTGDCVEVNKIVYEIAGII